MKSRLQSTVKMTNTGYYYNEKPRWWARIGTGPTARFIDIPYVRGDVLLDVEVDLPPGTQVHIGAGKGNVKTVRETVKTIACDEEGQP